MDLQTKRQIESALWYLKRHGHLDVDKAIGLLSEILGSNKNNPKTFSLSGYVLVAAVGHGPGGGTEGEREWNTKLGQELVKLIEKNGGKGYLHLHKSKSYSTRQNKLADFCRQKNAFLCWELHYDAVPNTAVKGHHFKYRGAKEWAKFTQEEWSRRYPQSRPRYSSGIHHATTGYGSGFLRRMPCWALLTEPFFNSNKEERNFYKDKIDEIAEAYLVGAERFIKHKNKK